MNVVDQSILQGETFVLTATVDDVNGNPNSSLLNGATAAMMLRNNYSDPAPLLSLTSIGAGAPIVINPTLGTVVATITAAQTGALFTGKGVYDLKLTLADGITTQRLMEGVFTVFPAVTR